MKEDVKVQFIDALLSGNYSQIRGQLRRNYMVCANGVLCELAIQNGVSLRHGRDGFGYYTPSSDGLDHYWSMTPPESVMEWAGVDRAWVRRLIGINDGNDTERNGHSFEDIAEIVKNGGPLE